MQILLPPSETKREGGAGRLDLASLHDAATLGETRNRVRAALEALCDPAADEAVAVKSLKLGVKNRGELLRNRALGTSGVMPALDRYTGVLYDALDAATLDDDARAWAGSHVRIQSALFGQLAALDAIPVYRLSGGSRLPALGTPLKRVWAPAHAAAATVDGGGFTLDLRSKDYAELAPLAVGAGELLHVAQREANGQVRALNHFNKAAKGDLVRRLATAGRSVTTLEELLHWAAAAGLELGFEEERLTLVTELGAPSRH